MGLSITRSSWVVGVWVWAGITPVAGQDENPRPSGAVPDRIDLLIEQLGDERFATREEARSALMEIGRPAIPALLEATTSDSPERRIRAARLVQGIRDDYLKELFTAMGKRADADLDVEHAMWAVALFLDPDLERQRVTATLDRMAASVRRKLGAGKVPSEMPPREVVSALISVLRDEYGLKGDEETYVHPDNSSVHRVLERRKGLPILLSEIAVAVARRIDVPIVGLPIPGRYMIKYDGRQAPPGQPAQDIIINPYENWKLTNVGELLQTVRGFDPLSDLQASGPRETIARIMRNMEGHAHLHRRPALADSLARCLEMLDPGGPGGLP